MEVLSKEALHTVCPVKWHNKIPLDGISLGVADVDFSGPKGIVEYIKNNIEESHSFYQAQNGLLSAIESIQNFFTKRNIMSDPNQIQVIPGTMIGIYAAMKWASRRDGIVVCIGPEYEPIHRHATDNNNKIKWVNIEQNKLNHEELKQQINGETKLIALNNPSNPIGYTYTKEDLKVISDLASDYDIICFSDELYEPLTFGKNHVPLPSINELSERTIALYGFSKAYGLAGYRSGFMYLPASQQEEIHHIIESILVTPSPIPSIVCNYALNDVRARNWVTEFHDLMNENTRKASKYFRDNGFPCLTPEGCFFVFPNIKVDDVKFSEDLLIKQGVQVIPGSHFGPTGKNHIRINCGTSEERLFEGLKRIIDYLDQH